jgi:hypothetical protein
VEHFWLQPRHQLALLVLLLLVVLKLPLVASLAKELKIQGSTTHGLWLWPKTFKRHSYCTIQSSRLGLFLKLCISYRCYRTTMINTAAAQRTMTVTKNLKNPAHIYMVSHPCVMLRERQLLLSRSKRLNIAFSTYRTESQQTAIRSQLLPIFGMKE